MRSPPVLAISEGRRARPRGSHAQNQSEDRVGIPSVIGRKLDDLPLALSEWGCLTHRIGGAE